jgi:hypothetical protein
MLATRTRTTNARLPTTLTSRRPSRRRLNYAAGIKPGTVQYLVSFETAFSSVRAWSIWSHAYVAMAVVVIVPPFAGERFVGLVAEDVA